VYVHVYIKPRKSTVLLLTMLRIDFVVCFVPYCFHKHMQWVIIWSSSWPIPLQLQTTVRDSLIGIALKLADIPGSNFNAASSIAEFTEANHIRVVVQCIKERRKIVNISEVSWRWQLIRILVVEQIQCHCEWRD